MTCHHHFFIYRDIGSFLSEDTSILSAFTYASFAFIVVGFCV